ncbi:MAG: PLP-dependent aspartate aminotransferase family protein [Kangiellaceae bacterium]|nr:PLP-dependent aspartate aminotransferase family protein [Kangiellaceae bacterium]
MSKDKQIEELSANGLNTRCVHGGRIEDKTWNSVTSPIIQSTAYRYRETEKRGYPRYFESPNQEIVVNKLCALEKTESGILVSSGMAAISTTILALVKSGDHIIIQQEVYGGTSEFFSEVCRPLGIEFSFVKTSVKSINDAITDRTMMIFLESPTNPTLSVLDIKNLVSLVKDKNIITVIDNTFATPINQNPSQLGVDIIIHSGTKFLSGHSDLCSGVVLGPEMYIAKIKSTARSLGGCLNARDCYLLERSLKTLNLRVNQQTNNAVQLARFLFEHPAVTNVFYPGLQTSVYYSIAKSQMNNFGSMITFQLSDDYNADTLMDNLSLIIPASSLGGVETTVSIPWYASHQKMPEDNKLELGITKQLLRLSTGIENIGDLIDDLSFALSECRLTKQSFG